MALKKHADATTLPDKDASEFAKEVRRVMLVHINGSARSVQKTIGPSQAGSPCDREIVYKLTGTEVGPDGNPWLPFIGTMGHVGMAEAFEAENNRLGRERYLIEKRVSISAEIPSGSIDLFDVDDGVVTDWKFVGKTTLDSVRAKGSKPLYKKQVGMYGFGLAREGYQVNKCRIVYLPRNASPVRPFLDEMRVDEFDFDLDDAIASVKRIQELNKVAGGISPATRDKKILDVVASPSKDNCFFCSYRRICPDAGK